MKSILGDRIIKLKWFGMRFRIYVYVVYGVFFYFCWELRKWISCENGFVRLVLLFRGTFFFSKENKF